MNGFAASTWPAADLSAVGLGSDDDQARISQGTLGRQVNAARKGQAFLEWMMFQLAVQIYDRVVAGVAAEGAAEAQRKVIDIEARAVLALQQYLEGTEYQGRMLLEDAFAARDRLPQCATLLKVGTIDRRRFHRIVAETDLVIDEDRMRRIDTLVYGEILALGGRALSEQATTNLVRRHVAEIDPDGVRARRENAKNNRTLYISPGQDGMSAMTLVASAEDVRLLYAAIDAVIAGLCPDDPRTKAAARSDALVARLLGTEFVCGCGTPEGCTATLDPGEVDARLAHVVIHVLADKSTLDGGDKPGYLDGYGVISADHVRELAGRGDAVVREHDLNDLLEDTTDAAAEGVADIAAGQAAAEVASDDFDDDVFHRQPSRSETPAACGGDTPYPEDPDAGQDGREPVIVIDQDQIDRDFEAMIAGMIASGDAAWACADADAAWEAFAGVDWDALEAKANEFFAWLDADIAAGQAGQADPVDEFGVIGRTALPSDPYRPNTLTDLLARFLWGTCSIPGCARPAFACDLDHVEEFNPSTSCRRKLRHELRAGLIPAQGGPTCLCNLLPKCRFHHLVKTHVEGFIDELWLDESGRYVSAITQGGVTIEMIAPNQWLLPQLAALRCRHQLSGQTGHTGEVPVGAAESGPDRARTRTQAKHARRRCERNRNRREREEHQARAAHAAACRAWLAAEKLWHDNQVLPPF